MIILIYSKIFRKLPHKLEWSHLWIDNYFCNLTDKFTNKTYINKKILVTDNKSLLIHSSALIYHAYDVNNLFINKTLPSLSKMIYILYSRESPRIADILLNETLMNQYNLLMSYHSFADIPIPWLTINEQKKIYFNNISNNQKYLTFEQKTNLTNDTLIAWISSNCKWDNGRHIYLKKLFKYIKYDSFGKCLNNQKNGKLIPRNVSIDDIYKLISKYKFYVAIENANCGSLITEKINKAISSNSIPIIFSVNNTPNYQKFLPKDSYINIADFKTPKLLASYLKLVATNKTLYDNYFKHKNNNNINFKFSNNEFSQQWCRAANVIYNYKKYYYKSHKTLNSDKSCLDKNIIFKFI